jgi:integrase
MEVKKKAKRKREPEKYIGVYERISNTRKFEGKPDVCFMIYYRNSDQKLIGEKVGWLSEGYSPKAASIVRSERLRSIRHNDELPGEKPKAPFFEDVTKKYLEWAKDNKKSWKADESRIDTHLTPSLEGKRLDEISSFDLERLKSDLGKKGLSAATVKHTIVLVRQIFNRAIAWSLYQGVNPIKGVKLPTLQNQRERFLSFEEADALLAALKAKSKTVHDMALLSVQCGLRFGEIANLRGHDVDFRNGLISISDPKNNEGRKAFMTNAVREVLVGRMPVEQEEYVFKDTKHKDKITHVSRTFFEVVKDLELNKGVTDPRQKVSFHSLRHTFASWLALQGESLLTIRELMGHKSLAMVQRYAHLSADSRKQATLRLEKAYEQRGYNNITEIRQ